MLCWTEKDNKSGKYYLVYSKWDNVNMKFHKATKIKETFGMQYHEESMGKIGFTSKGIMIAVYGVKKPTPKNKYAGYIAYTKSIDNGKTWLKSVKLVKDTSSQSQRFFDIERLPDGSIGISWLDNRKLELKKDGSTLYFAKTNDNGDFIDEKPLVGSTCQCCRTDIFVDDSNVVHIAFRDIIRDSIRDMKHVFSLNFGKNFTEAYLISEDNWVIYGCPHTGPSIAYNKNGIAYAWFTLGGGEGVYFSKGNDLKSNNNRVLISNKLYHPQMIGLRNGLYLLGGEEIANIGDIYFGQIVLFVIDSNGIYKKKIITGKKSDNSHVVLKELEDKRVLLVWAKHKRKGALINYSIFKY